MKKLIVSIFMASSILTANAQTQYIEKLYVQPAGSSPETLYNGLVSIKKPAASAQYINLARYYNATWSIGTVYNSNTFAIGQSTSNDADFNNPFFTLTPTGNVGIGTADPSYKLDVNAGTGVGARIRNGTNYINIGGIGSGTSYIKGFENIVAFGNGLTSGSTTLIAGSTERLRINPSGNVGIGTTSPGSLLDVRGVNSVTSGGHDIGAFANVAGTAGVINGWYANGSAVTGGWSRSINNLPYFLGTTTTQQALTILDNGSVGIGTTSPWTGTKLDVRGNIFLDSGIDDTHIFWGGHNMTMGTPVDQYAHNVFSLKPGGSTQGDLFTRFCMYTSFKKDSIIQKVQISSAESSFFMGGNVGIGIKAPQYLLDVAGTIRAKEVIVTVNGFPDFVFDKKYTLQKLQDVDNYIQSNGHLPNIPSAKDVEKNGMSMADLQVKLLQKVEELTLYAIEQQKRIEQLENALKDNK